MLIPTLLQARWRAVFFTASCRVRSAFAVLTSSSEQWEWEGEMQKNRLKSKQCSLLRSNVIYLVKRSYQRRWSGHFQQPSSVGFSLRHQHCWPESCGSATAGDTPHGRWRLLHVVGSCKNNTRTRLTFLIKQSLRERFGQVGRMRLQFLLGLCLPVFTVFGIDNGRAKSVYQHLSSTFVVMDPN